MSSLAATQADGMYVPPSYLESGAYKSKSLNQYAGSKGHNQFLQRGVCRFELPFDGFCTKCGAIVGKGTRFNAHKAHVDDYFTTKIYEFTTRCRACGDCEFKVRTNPKERTFDYVSGLRKKVEEFDTAAAGTAGVIDTEFGNGILEYRDGGLVDAPDDGPAAAAPGLGQLEKRVAGHRKAQTEHERMTSLLALNSWKGEDADANAAVRASFRKDRKAKRRRLGEAGRMGLGRGIELLAEGAEEDAARAREAMGRRRREREAGSARRKEAARFRSAGAGSIFGAGGGGSSGGRGGRRSGRRKTAATGAGRSEGSKSKSSAGGNEAKSVANRTITIRHKKGGFHSTKSTEDEAPGASEDGALAALSGFYASDSD